MTPEHYKGDGSITCEDAMRSMTAALAALTALSTCGAVACGFAVLTICKTAVERLFAV